MLFRGAGQSVGADVPVAIWFCNDDASIRREVVASLCSSLWLHAVLCALCSFAKKSSVVSLRELYRKEFAGSIARSKSVLLGLGRRARVLGVFAAKGAILLATRL